MKAVLIAETTACRPSLYCPQHQPRSASRAHHVEKIEDCIYRRVERAEPLICRRPQRGLDRVQCSRKQPHRGDQADNDREHLMRAESVLAFQPEPDIDRPKAINTTPVP